MPGTVTVGCEAYIVRDNQFLLGLRGPATYGPNTWALPGGRVEPMERVEDCMIREIKEELGIAVTDDPQHHHNQHHLHLTFAVHIGNQAPQLLEPESCLEWRWFNKNSLPEPIFPPHTKIFSTIASGSIYI